MRTKGNLNSTCSEGHKVDELNVSCRESEMSSERILVCGVFYILKGKISLDMGQKEARFIHTKHIYDSSFKSP